MSDYYQFVEINLGIVEIRCPRCGSPCSTKNRKAHEYQCDHCGAIFHFIDTTRKEVVHDTRTRNCPICGRPVEAGDIPRKSEFFRNFPRKIPIFPWDIGVFLLPYMHTCTLSSTSLPRVFDFAELFLKSLPSI